MPIFPNIRSYLPFGPCTYSIHLFISLPLLSLLIAMLIHQGRRIAMVQYRGGESEKGGENTMIMMMMIINYVDMSFADMQFELKLDIG